jgi:type II restriction/modification system DNA methylase subunit YeeA
VRFLRLWFEVSINNIGFNYNGSKIAEKGGIRWFPYNKGGKYRKWYGNGEYVINWENNGYEIKNLKNS